MLEREITFLSHGRTLAGTITRPEVSGDGPYAAALLVVGSGKINRDSNMPKLKLQVTRIIAERLARLGIVTLRYDKRGVGSSEGEYYSSGLTDNVRDATEAYHALVAQPEVDGSRLFVIGHSEGALVALELAASELGLRGAVMLAGAAQTGEAVLRWQAEQVVRHAPWLVRAILRVFRVDLAKLQTKRFGQLRATTTDSTRIQMVKINARWFREFLDHDPAAALQRLRTPVLAMTGTDDVQADHRDVGTMGELSDGRVEGHIIEGMNHILRSGGPSPQSYRKQLHLPLHEQALRLMADWLTARASI